MKKLLSVCLAVLCMVCAAVACGETSGDFEYEVLPDGTVEITGYTGDDETLVIPMQLDGHAVTGIGEDAFYDCYRLTSITIPDSVTSIGDSAFSGCSSLTSISIPDGVTRIGHYAFFECSSLTSLVLPDSVTSIGAGAFYYCSSLTSINIPRHCKVYNSGMYYNGNDVTKAIDSGIYYDIHKIWVVVIDVLDGCDSLPYADYSLYWLEDSVVIKGYYGDETELVIPDEIYGRPVTSIGDHAFSNNTNLTSITIPDSVTSIGDGAFTGCDGLTDESGLFIFRNTVYTCRRDVTSITIPDGVTSIGVFAFQNCESLTSITIPDSVTSIGDSAFYECYSLTSIAIPDGVTSIGDYAFFNCGSLTSITIPDSVTSIGDYAFYFCESLTSITIPDSVTRIGEGAFQYCGSLTGINFPRPCRIVNSRMQYDNGEVTELSINILEGCDSLPYADYSLYWLKDSVVIKGYYGSDTELVIPAEIYGRPVTSIGDYAFFNNSDLTSITIPAGVMSIGEGSFEDCDSLTAVIVTPGSYAEQYCKDNGIPYSCADSLD